ncbi:sensor domain-containing protein [Chloroflexota bacterium]
MALLLMSRQIEAHLQPTLVVSQNTEKGSIISQFFGVFADPRAWGALLYLLFSLGTGVIYFAWAITGISMSLSFLILIIGLPFAGVFLLSVRGIALIEGRIVEALLGTRMPRRPLFSRKNIGWWPKLKSLVTERRTWITMIYMILQLPLGIIYFTMFVFMISLSLGLIAQPFLELAFNQQMFKINDIFYYTPIWLMPLIIIIGFLLLTLTMHLAKFVGQKHGTLAKAMLVRT